MTLTIGFVSGFLVADDSMLAAYGEGFEKYNIEHGNFTLSSKASESDLKKIEKNGKVRICENFYRDEATDADLTVTKLHYAVCHILNGIVVGNHDDGISVLLVDLLDQTQNFLRCVVIVFYEKCS